MANKCGQICIPVVARNFRSTRAPVAKNEEISKLIENDER